MRGHSKILDLDIREGSIPGPQSKDQSSRIVQWATRFWCWLYWRAHSATSPITRPGPLNCHCQQLQFSCHINCTIVCWKAELPAVVLRDNQIKCLARPDCLWTAHSSHAVDHHTIQIVRMIQYPWLPSLMKHAVNVDWYLVVMVSIARVDYHCPIDRSGSSWVARGGVKDQPMKTWYFNETNNLSNLTNDKAFAW